MSDEKRYKAVVECLVKIEVTDRWGAKVTMDQIERQALHSAEKMMDNLLNPIGWDRMTSIEQGLHEKAIKTVSRVKMVHVEAKQE